MQPLLSCAEAGELDLSVQDRYALPPDLLMENAAAGMFRSLAGQYRQQLFPEQLKSDGPDLLVLCGGGSNGGDALALARHALFAGVRRVSILVPVNMSPIAGRRLVEAQAAGAELLYHDDPTIPLLLDTASLIVDGLTGSGYRPAPGRSLPLLDLVRRQRQTQKQQQLPQSGSPRQADYAQPKELPPLVALDLPSGLCALPPGCLSSDDYAPLPADQTLTVLPAKQELYYPGNRNFTGCITGIGGVFPLSAINSRTALLEPGDLADLLAPPAPDAHKGSRGALGIYAGDIGSSGAALLCSRAASAGGAGTITLHLRDRLYPLLAGSLDNVMVRPWSAGRNREYRALLLGPGLGRDTAAETLLAEAWQSDLPLVLDADALHFAGAYQPRSGAVRTILLPHPGEYEALLRRSGLLADTEIDLQQQVLFNTAELLGQLAVRLQAVVVLKNSVTWLAHPDGRFLVYDGREPALGCGGSGDILAGFTAALLASGQDAWNAAAAAVLVHGQCGKKLARQCGYFNPLDLCADAAAMFYRGACNEPGA